MTPWSGSESVNVQCSGSPFIKSDKSDWFPAPEFTLKNGGIPQKALSLNSTTDSHKVTPFTEHTLFVQYSNFRIDHPDVEGIDISNEINVKSGDDDNYHSPIFDDAGLQIIDRLWKRTVVGLDTSKP